MNGNTSSMMDDINKYAAIWDTALAKGIFPDKPIQAKPENEEEEESFFGADFFGQNLRSAEYDMDEPLNEVDTKYWAQISRLADPNSYLKESKEEIKSVADAMGKAHNPVLPNTIGKDQNLNVAQNWGVGGKEYFQLEELKVRLEKLESKLNAIEGQGKSGKDSQSKIDELKKQIDNLSDSLDGERFSNDG